LDDGAPSADGSDIARRRGRRVGIVLFRTIVSGITAIWALQIIDQVWFEKPNPSDIGCQDGMRSLVDSVRRARRAAAAETGGERQALARFRGELADAWQLRAAIGQACSSDPEATRTLGEIDRLSYAEEHAVRYESVDLAGRRRRVQPLENDLSSTGNDDKP
jgi:hypothetical protein